MPSKIRVLVVDDSLFMRKAISSLLNSDPKISVIGTAKDGEEALQKISELNPDVITLDIEMPRMDGLTTLKEIMRRKPLPVIMLSALTKKGAKETFTALEYGAVDYVLKPSGTVSLDLKLVKDQLIAKIKTAALTRPLTHKTIKPSTVAKSFDAEDKVIAMGASTGGPQALTEILSRLPEDIPPTLIVQHMPEGFTRFFAEHLDEKCQFKVKEAENGDQISRGLALVAPGGYHMLVQKNGRILLDKGPRVHNVRPAVDPMMFSVAEAYSSKVVGVLLTGMGKDGAKGMKAIKKKGGATIAQDEETCVVFGMPKAAIEEGCVDIVLPLHKIPIEIVRRCRE